MQILGIETSCDETAAAVVVDGKQVLSHALASSVAIQEKYGGVVPEQAAREQLKAIIPVIHETLTQSSLQPSQLDAIAVTVGPGLIGSLLVGVETAKTLSWVWGKPLIPVNHLLAHFYAAWIGDRALQFPLVGLLVSGGHTDLILMQSHKHIQHLGGTRDDAAGETFDKTARLIGLPYPGGAAVAALAEKYNTKNEKRNITLPRPLMAENTLEFSFSGLKTAALRETQRLKEQGLWHDEAIVQFAYEIQEAITDVLVQKTLKAVVTYRPKSLVLAGGVAANARLREKVLSAIDTLEFPIAVHMPPPELCTDNAVMVAACAYYHQNPVPFQQVQANPSLSLRDFSLPTITHKSTSN